MLLSIPENIGKSRLGDAGALGFPWAAVANIVINAAYGGWNYYLTNQQIKQTMRISGTTTATPQEIKAAADVIEQKLGVKMPRSELEKYIASLITAAPEQAAGMAPSQFLEARLTALEQRQLEAKPTGIPTWGWIAIAGLGFLIVMQTGLLKR